MISHGIIWDRDAIGRYNKERDTAKEKEIDEIKKMISDWKSIKEIAKEMWVHYKSIYRKLKKD